MASFQFIALSASLTFLLSVQSHHAFEIAFDKSNRMRRSAQEGLSDAEMKEIAKNNGWTNFGGMYGVELDPVTLKELNPPVTHEKKDESGCICPDSKFPMKVCGDDGMTYNNSDALICENKCRNGSVLELHIGRCQPLDVPPSEECPRLPNDFIVRVCGSDGRTYANSEDIEFQNRCMGQRVYALYQGNCRKPGSNGPCKCDTGDNKPVCGNDGVTYRDEQSLQCNNKCNNTNIQQLYSGECRPEHLASANRPAVCGSNGKTYRNHGELERARAKGIDVAFCHEGPCKLGRREETRVEALPWHYRLLIAALNLIK